MVASFPGSPPHDDDGPFVIDVWGESLGMRLVSE